MTCGGNGPATTAGATESSATTTTEGAPTSGETTGCILGSNGCPCVEGLCLGDLVCQEGLCVTADGTGTTASSETEGGTSSSTGPIPQCGATINGNVMVANSLQLEQLSGVSFITGGLTIAQDLGPIPQLACLEEAKALDLHEGNDYTAMQSLHAVESLMLHGGEGTSYPMFAELVSLEYLYLFYVDEILAFPKVSNIFELSLDGSSAPEFSAGLSMTLLFLTEGQGDYSTLDGVAVNYFDVNGYFGTSLPAVKVDTRLSVSQAPNLTSLAVDFGSTFPAQPPATIEEESNVGISLGGTGLANLDDLAGVTTYTSRLSVVGNSALVDISGLTGASVTLSYDLPPNAPGMSIGQSPMLCLSHAQMVAGTMTLPAPASLYGLNDGC